MLSMHLGKTRQFKLFHNGIIYDMGCGMIYIYRTRIGTFSIEPDDIEVDMFKLCIGGLWLGSYETEEDAARSVYLRESGWHDWDCSEDSDAPCDLSEWEKQ
ncbi:MAG: hypothetical protein JXC33_06205 [Deltaproteobacteria bacterium]|nr:hypothetical protein [Deltaproteobacteria bacterium]